MVSVYVPAGVRQVSENRNHVSAASLGSRPRPLGRLGVSRGFCPIRAACRKKIFQVGHFSLQGAQCRLRAPRLMPQLVRDPSALFEGTRTRSDIRRACCLAPSRSSDPDPSG